jgi:hypothetical protein
MADSGENPTFATVNLQNFIEAIENENTVGKKKLSDIKNP